MVNLKNVLLCDKCSEFIVNEDYYYMDNFGYKECDICHREYCKLLKEEAKGNYVNTNNNEYCDMLGLIKE